MMKIAAPLLPLENAFDPASSGRKAANLALLAGAGLRVPRGFVIPAAAPEEAWVPALPAAFAALGARFAAVRSSSPSEDGAVKSFAGQFDSFLGVGAGRLEEAVRGCLTSAAGARAAAYGGTAGAMAVIVQEMVEPEASGVAFSCDPVSGDRGRIVIEAVYGLCEPLVSGKITPDHYELDRGAFGLRTSLVARQAEFLAAAPAGGTRYLPVPTEKAAAPKLGEGGLRLVGEAAARAEELLGAPADIEWALAGGELYLLQARPVTGLGD